MNKGKKLPNRIAGTPGETSARSGHIVKFQRTDYLTASILTALSFLIYIFTMSRSIPYIDGGELTTVLWTLGIAHPTGYPLFTLLGSLFVHIPIFHEVAMRANLFAVACTASAGGLFYLVFFRAQTAFVISGHANRSPRKEQIDNSNRTLPVTLSGEAVSRIASGIAALCLIFSATFWDQSTSIEVYPLQLVLFALILISWLKFYITPTRRGAFLAGLTLGLGFTNHMTTILTVPAILFLFLMSYRKRRYRLTIVYPMILGGLLPLLPYLYLPIRASQDPLLDWGNPDTLKRFIWHVSGKQFRTWMFSSFNVFEHQTGVFFSSLYSEFGISIIVVVIGFVVSLYSYRRYFWWTVLLLLGDIAYAANYNIHDISSYFLLAYIALALFAALGFHFILVRIFRKSSKKAVILALFLLFPAYSAVANFSAVNQSDDYAVEMYTRDILTSLPRNSVVLSFQWDIFVSGSLYYQHVDNLRKDVIVIDKELLRRSWYAAQVHHRYSFLFPKQDAEYAAYQANLRLFENGLPYDPNSIQQTYSDFIREIISGALKRGRDVFVGPEMEDKYLFGYNKVPYGLMYELATDTNYVAYSPAGLNGFRAAQRVNNDYSHQIENFYTRMFLARAAYEYEHRHFKRTLAWIDKTLQVDPASQAAQNARLEVQHLLEAGK